MLTSTTTGPATSSAMYVVTEAGVAAIRPAYETGGELFPAKALPPHNRYLHGQGAGASDHGVDAAATSASTTAERQGQSRYG